MEKLSFTIRFIVLLVAFPVIMYTELTRPETKVTEQRQNIAVKSSAKNDAAMLDHFPLTQAVFN
jgi:hypothetical protein